MPVRAVSARVTGRVQGVWFRAWTRERAKALGLTGWVRNRPDGAVEAWFCGPAEAVSAMEEALLEGPPHARVDKVALEKADPGAAPEDFTIRRG